MVSSASKRSEKKKESIHVKAWAVHLMWKQPLKKKCDTIVERWGVSLWHQNLTLKPNLNQKKEEKKKQKCKLGDVPFLLVSDKGSHDLEVIPCLYAQRTPARASSGMWTKSLSQDNPVNTALIWICAFISDTICYCNYEGYTGIVSVHVHECLCAWLSHRFSVTVCAEGSTCPQHAGPVSLLSQRPESKKQAGTEGLSHITSPFIEKAQGREAADSHI